MKANNLRRDFLKTSAAHAALVSFFAIGLLLTARVVHAETVSVVFDGSTSERKWTLKELNPALPSDWSSNQFLTLELRSSTAQRFELRIFTTNGVRHIRLHPFANAWIRAAIPLAYFQRPDRQGFDLASLGNKSRASYWINLMGGYGPLNAVEAIGLVLPFQSCNPSKGRLQRR